MFKTIHFLALIILACCWGVVRAQEVSLTGKVRDKITRLPVEGVAVGFNDKWAFSGDDGEFVLKTTKDSLVLTCSGVGYVTANFPIQLHSRINLDLGDLWLQPDSFGDGAPEDYVVISDQSDDDYETTMGMPLLRGTRDIFLSRAAFDFSAGYFRVRGLDSRESTLIFNGLSMNRTYDGRPAWSNWAGLADISRNSAQTPGWNFSGAAFGGLSGVIDITASPSSLRSGTKLTASLANKSYQFRSMATFNSGINQKGLGFLISVVSRIGSSGYTAGTPFTGYAGYTAFEWHPNLQNALLVSGMLSYQRRGSAAPLSQELVDLMGHRYNPHWGVLNGKVRNARLREGSEPYLSLLYTYKSGNFSAKFAAGHQWGVQTRSRLTAANAPNPDPSYYRNLPSFYYNSPLGANYQNTNWARTAFQNAPQIDWEAMFQANQNRAGSAAYFILGDEQMGKRSQLRTTATLNVPKSGISLLGGFRFLTERIQFNGRLLDLLGGKYLEDRDAFNGTLNDVEGPTQKSAGDLVGYAYLLQTREWEAFFQGQWNQGPWEFGISGLVGGNTTAREGLFLNERYPFTSKTKGGDLRNNLLGIKWVLGYQLSGHYWIYGHAGFFARPPVLQEVFVDPRENDNPFPLDFQSQKYGASLDVYVRYPWLNGKFSGYFLQATGGRSLKTYYAETGYGTGFMREVTGDIGTQHAGLEVGMEFRLSPSVALTVVAAGGSNIYSNSPSTQLYYYPEPSQSDRLPNSGVLDMGKPNLRGLHLSRGPERVGSIGVSYRDPGFWWIDIRANSMNRAYEDIAFLRHVPDFKLNPNTGLQDVGATQEAVHFLREQHPLPPLYHLNLSGGKSWMKHHHYISFFIGLNNLFNVIGPTGGYQQGRMATYSGLWDDIKSGHPSFGAKHWYASGRTYFINLSWSF